MSLLVEVQNPEAYQAIPSYNQFASWSEACWLDESDAEVVIRLVGEEESRTLNRDYRGRDYATNVLSFNYDTMDLYPSDIMPETEGVVAYLGDLVICVPVIEREAGEQNKQAVQHWVHMVVHGMLHLQGFDHIKEIEADIMEAREIDILYGLGFPNPYEPI